jgi:Uma2 family endonuclease
MAKVADKLWTLEEFLAFDDGTDTSYQLFEGRIVAMNPPLRGHAVLTARLVRMVGSRLKPPCEAAADNHNSFLHGTTAPAGSGDGSNHLA